MPDFSEQQTYRTIEKRIHKTSRLTAQDAAMLTGLGIDEVSRSLEKLMVTYQCKLQVTDSGDLIYDFGKRPKRRGKKTIGEIMFAVVQWLWKAFKVLFKVWIVVMLVAYFVFYLVVLIALIVAMASNNKGKKGSSIGMSLLKVAFNVFIELFKWNTLLSTTKRRKDKHGYSYKTYDNKAPFLNQLRKDTKKLDKRFIATVFDFVFGPDRVTIDPLANQKEVAAFLRQQNGIVVLSELKGLAGWSADEAQSFFSDCIVRFRGETKVSDNGVFYGDFHEFTRKATDEKGAEIIWYWDEYEADYLLNGNTTRRNLLIAGMNAFNLVFSIFFLNASPFLSDLTDGSITNGFLFLSLIPFVFSVLFFFIPLVRFFVNLYLKHKRYITNIKKRLIKIIYFHKEPTISLDAIEKEVNRSSSGEAKIPKNKIKTAMEEILTDFEGDIEPTEENVQLYQFKSLKEEQAEALRLRAQRKDADLGEVVFDTADFT